MSIVGVEQMEVRPDELRAVGAAATNIVDDLATVIEDEMSSGRVVYHEDNRFVAVLISAEIYEALLEEASA